MNVSNYHLLRDQIRTGDVIFFSGKQGFSDLIKRFTRSKFSHCAIVLEIKEDWNCEDRLFCVESTTYNRKTADIDGTYRRGCQITPLSQRIDGFEGEMWWCPLLSPLDENAAESAEMVKFLLGTHASNIPYDYTQAVLSAINGPQWFKKIFRNNNEEKDLKALFCSELVTRALQIAGKVPPEVIASELTPQEVMDLKVLGPPIPLF